MFFQKKRSASQVVERSFYSLGTLCNIKIFTSLKSPKNFQKEFEIEMEDILDRAEALAYKVDDQFSIFKEESEISRINKNSGQGTTKVNSSTYFLIKKAIEFCEISEGGMDITIGPLSRIWRESIKTESLPSSKSLVAAKEQVDFRKIKIEESNTSVLLEKQGMELDLGCIAKGYCADLIRDFLEENGVESALINLGGNIVAIGSQTADMGWRIGVQHPEQSRENFIGYLDIKDLSVVTSGDYERYFEQNGKRFHHIIDPRTASQVETDIVSVTILSKSSMDGDGLTTAVYMLGAKKGMELMNRMNGIEGLIIAKEKEIYISSGIKEMFRLADESYRIINKFGDKK